MKLISEFGRGADLQKRKSRNTLAKIAGGIGTVGAVGAGTFLARKPLGNLGNNIMNKLKPPKPTQSTIPKIPKQPAALPAKSTRTVAKEQNDQWREQFRQNEMKKDNAFKEKLRIAKEAEKAAKRQSNIKRTNPNAARNRAIIKEAGIQKDQKILNNTFKDLKENPKDFADLERSILRSKKPQGFANPQPKPKKQNKSNQKNRRR